MILETRHLLDLETRLGLPLFHRLGNRMAPTPAGGAGVKCSARLRAGPSREFTRDSSRGGNRLGGTRWNSYHALPTSASLTAHLTARRPPGDIA